LGFDASEPAVAEPAPAEPAANGAAPKVDVFAQAMSARAAAPAAVEPPPAVPEPPKHDFDEDIDIGEVSRVVKLADIARTPSPRKSGPISTGAAASPRAATNATGAVPRIHATGAVPRLQATGAIARINATGSIAKIDALPNTFADAPAGDATLEPAVHTHSPVQAQHKRGLVLLLLGAIVIAAAVVVVMVVVMKDDAPPATTTTAYGDDFSIDNTRPDNLPIPKVGPGSQELATPGSGSEKKPDNTKTQTQIARPYKPPVQEQPKDKTDPALPTGTKIDGGEVEAMAKATNGATSTCFIRSNKGAEAILLADVKRVNVNFTINPDGTVKDASFGLEAGLARLTSCLNNVVRTWKFRPSPGGNYRITMVPPS
ncbi:MAG: hypothetical protein KF773_42985, partial [Deltaproteobacteria bacterium]|nr:hypothetical protein [Deltaproteobacteria bacterium]